MCNVLTLKRTAITASMVSCCNQALVVSKDVYVRMRTYIVFEMMAALATPISEEWIRERVGLNHENLGQYHLDFKQ